MRTTGGQISQFTMSVMQVAYFSPYEMQNVDTVHREG